MIINNVKLVLENEVVSGSLEVQNGEIRAFAESQSRLPEAMDGEGGWLLPGLIELHTDNLDKFFTPRPKVDWPAHSAMSSHDALMVASGITTVLDAVAIGDVRDGGDRLENLEKMINAIEETQKRGVNRAEHRLHLRCELPHHTTLWCWRIARAITFISTTSGVRVKGCSDDGKTDLVNGAVRLRER